MNAFETIAARFFEVDGYWTRVGVKLDISKAEKAAIGNPSMPRPEIDVVCWKPAANELLIVECKSYLDSDGVRFEHFHGTEVRDDVFKVLNRPRLRELVVTALVRQLRNEGLLAGDDPLVRFVVVAGKIYSDHEDRIRTIFDRNGWTLITPRELAAGVRRFASRGYENDLLTVVTKLLERNI
jgi:hypothetical protein